MNLPQSLTLLLGLVLSFNTYSQSFYIQPWVGAGITGTNESWWTNDHTILATTAGVKLGYSYSRIRLGIGVGLLNTGLGLKDLTFEPLYSSQTGQTGKVDVRLKYSELFVPATFGVKILEAGKFMILPEIGLAPTYTVRYSGKLTNQTTGEVKTVVSNLNERFSMLGLGAINITYNLHPKLGIMLTPTYYRMLNDVTELSSNPNRYAVTANVGVVLVL